MVAGNGLTNYAKKVGIICGAAIAAGTVLQFVGGFLWGQATHPIMVKIEALQVSAQEERVARQHNDSLMVEQIASLGEAMRYPVGSYGRDHNLKDVAEAPDEARRARWRKR